MQQYKAKITQCYMYNVCAKFVLRCNQIADTCTINGIVWVIQYIGDEKKKKNGLHETQ